MEIRMEINTFLEWILLNSFENPKPTPPYDAYIYCTDTYVIPTALQLRRLQPPPCSTHLCLNVHRTVDTSTVQYIGTCAAFSNLTAKLFRTTALALHRLAEGRFMLWRPLKPFENFFINTLGYFQRKEEKKIEENSSRSLKRFKMLWKICTHSHTSFKHQKFHPLKNQVQNHFKGNPQFKDKSHIPCHSSAPKP